VGNRRRVRWILGPYLLIVTAIVGYNVREMAHQQGSALSVNVAARQRALAERYTKDVILRTQQIPADPGDDAEQLLTNAIALLNGGEVVAVQGADEMVQIHPASRDQLVIDKLQEEQRLIGELITAGSALLGTGDKEAGYRDQVQELRVVAAQVTSISNDAVGQMTRDAEAAFTRLVAMGFVLGVLGVIAALTMGLLLRRTAAQQAAQFRSLVHNATDLITVVDPDGTIRYQSPSADRLIGCPAEELLGTSYLDALDERDQTHLRSVFRELARSSSAEATAEYRLRHADGSWRCVESIVSNLLFDPNVRGLVLNTRDVTDRKILQDELAHQAFHDSLTGLFNRAVFRDRVDHALARGARAGQTVAVLLLDLDGFKTVNDSLGHDAGDELLVGVGRRLEASGRSSDTVARIGGDEFAILLEDQADALSARSAAERLLHELATPFEVRGREVFVRASIGIALSMTDGDRTDELIRNADTAMYAAKRGGKARYEFFEPLMYERAVARFEVQADLERALARSEFELHYQPIIDFATGGIEGIEALVRWHHPTRGLLSPIEFIPVAEETGLIVPLGTWVLGEACRQAAAWRRSDPAHAGMWVSVNLSTRQLLEPDLVERVLQILSESGLSPNALTLEITEGSLMQDVDETVTKLRGLKDLGVRLAIDDFGTGSSSLSYLRQFPIDVLKIDKAFVDEVAGTGPQGPLLVHAIIDMARRLGVDTIAEGIEFGEQLSELRLAGCSSGQGYLFARPLPADDLEAFLDRPVDAWGGLAPTDGVPQGAAGA
jgi:diguanylate cyclase (GGDEF)-like protein/PAS domain S-box-containing protein